MSERLVRVERFEELSEGMIVVVKDCDCGRRRCRAIILSPGGTCADCEGLCFAAIPPCHGDSDNGVCEKMVRIGAVHRIDDGLESPADQAVSTPVEQPAKETSDV